MSRQEENTKIKLVLPLLQKGLGYKNNELNFEHHVKNKRADIAIVIDDSLLVLIEVKDKSVNLDKHIDQVIEYGTEKQIEFVALTNGVEFRIYATFAKGVVSPEDRLIKSYKIKSPESPPSDLNRLFGRSQLPSFSNLKDLKTKLRPRATESDLTKILKKSTEDLYKILLPQFKNSYKTNKKFKNKIDLWGASVKLDTKDKKLIEKLCKEGSYSLINRVLFYRICEDRGPSAPKISEASLFEWRKMVEKPSKKLSRLFKAGAKEFSKFYNSPLFNSITFDDINWKENIILKVLSRFANVDFSRIDDDMIGKSYENHIPDSERKRLGQFYTPLFIVEYLVGRLHLNSNSKILDPACGSGTFLVHSLKELAQKTHISPNLIVENNLYGLDINPFATQLTSMNLLLGTLKCKRKPMNLNIIAADALVDRKISNSKLFTSRTFRKEANQNVRNLTKFFNHNKNKFDAVIGNPPYLCFGLRSNKGLKKIYQDFIRKRWKYSAEYKISYYPLFIERSIELLKNQGQLAFILPDSFLVGRYFSLIRKHILDTCCILEIVLCQENFWEDAEIGYPILLILKKEKNEKKRKSNKMAIKLAQTASCISAKKFVIHKYEQSWFYQTTRNRFELYFDEVSLAMVKQARKISYKLKEEMKGYSGAISSRGYSQNDIISMKYEKRKKTFKESLHSGSEIRPYKIEYAGGFLNVSSKLLRSGYNPQIMEGKKILIRQTGDSLIASVDYKGLYHLNNVHSLYALSDSVCLEWVCLLLNSSIINRIYHILSMELGRAMAQIDIDILENLPYLKPTKDQEREAKRIYFSLSNMTHKSLKYVEALNDAEELIRSVFRISKKSQEKASWFVKNKILAG